jgi:hypothetical protein
MDSLRYRKERLCLQVARDSVLTRRARMLESTIEKKLVDRRISTYLNEIQCHVEQSYKIME